MVISHCALDLEILLLIILLYKRPYPQSPTHSPPHTPINTHTYKFQSVLSVFLAFAARARVKEYLQLVMISINQFKLLFFVPKYNLIEIIVFNRKLKKLLFLFSFLFYFICNSILNPLNCVYLKRRRR